MHDAHLAIRTLVSMGLVAIVVGAGGPAGAEGEPPEPTELDYRRGDGAGTCPEARVVRNGIAARLGYDPFVDRAERRVDVRIQRRENSEGFAARIEIRRPDGSTGERRLTTADPNCSGLADALVFAVSVAIDPNAATGPSAEKPPANRVNAVEPARAHVTQAVAVARSARRDRADRASDSNDPAREETPADSPPASRPERRAPEQPGRDKWGLQGLLGFGAAVGTTPELVGTLRTGVRLVAPSSGSSGFALTIAGRFDLPALTHANGGVFRTNLYAAELAPCGRIGPFFVCGVGALGAQRLRGLHLRDSRTASVLFAGIGGRLGAAVALPRGFGVRFHTELLANVAGGRARIGQSIVWRTPPLSAGAGALVAYRFF